MTRLFVDGPTVIRAVAAAVQNLEAHVDEVDALNVFPVPDGDTGSNMLATMRAALAEAERLPEDLRTLDSVAEALSRGALTGARGNSGVILSQIIRGMTYGADGRRRANGLQLAEGLRRGSEVAYGAVLTPVEGTILTVIRDAADAAEAAAGRQPHVEAVLADVIAAAASSVQRTPTLLPVLEDAGVVDSGGQGLYRILEGALQVKPRDTEPPAPGGATPARASAPGSALSAPPAGGAAPVTYDHAGHGHAGHEGLEDEAHGYETEYLLASQEGGIDIAELRRAISAAGDSVVVAGDAWLARVHVHGERPDDAIAAGLRFGRLSNVAIRDLDDQVAHHSAVTLADAAGPAAPTRPAALDQPPAVDQLPALGQRPAPVAPAIDQLPAVDQLPATIVPALDQPPAPVASPAGPQVARRVPASRPAPPIAIVAVAHATGLARTLESLGARLVRPSHGSRPSVGEIAEAILAVGSGEVIVLPNDRDALLAARHAADLTPMVTVEIIATRNAAEGIVAAVAFDPGASLAQNSARMTAESEALRSFTVFTAARDSVVDGQAVSRGEVIAIDADKRLLAQETTIEAATLRALDRLDDFDLVTCHHGTGLSAHEVQELRHRILEQGWDVEVEMVPGGQRHDHLLVAVE
ncbi:MAG TPA: DAK2 domain-containing protein [Candidatus Deferrimicrobium sp.]|nr:DAK2 domain-containing protein [Candidatus Deferrimicrobium sp.]